jgi:tetratricopeptide (TPR) repeat protein
VADHKKNSKFIIGLLFSTSLATLPFTPVQAQTDELEPSFDSLTILEQRIINDPLNLDYQFAYANMASTLLEFDKAERAYRLMLRYNPELLRVKLDLALLYIKMQRYDEAKPLLDDVLASNPPPEVKVNVAQLLEITQTALKPNNYTASVGLGYANDTNANSGPSTGNITVFGTDVELEGSAASSRSDNQGFASLSLGHSYRFDSLETNNSSYRFNSNIAYYQTEQATIDTLDLKVAQLKIGPSLYLKDIKTKFSFNGSYSYIELHEQEYLDTAGAEALVDYAYSSKLLLSGQVLYEHRHFVNSEDVKTYTDRTGNAYQLKGSATYALTKDDIFQTSLTLRDEEARAQYYADNSVELGGTYTRLLPKDFFASANVGYKWLEYDGADELIDSTEVREDNVWKAGLTVGKKFAYNISTTLGYQYTDNRSNVQNYAYDNHRIMTSVGWSY